MATIKFDVRMILLLQVLLITAAIIGPLGCHSSAEMSDMRRPMSQSTKQQTTSTSPRGIIGALIHRDRFSSPSDHYRSPTEKLDEDAWRSLQRVRSLNSRGRVLLAAPSSSPSGQPDDWETPLSDEASGEYLMEISLGTPPQKFVAVADTGSDLVWLQCLPCQECYEQSQPRFDPSHSSTYANISCSSSFCETLQVTSGGCTYINATSNSTSGTGCSYAYGYGDGSETRGTLAQETISITNVVGGNEQAEPNFWFGCSHNATTSSGLFNRADGLVGLGRGSASFPSQLGKYFGNKFSYCLVNRTSSFVEESPLIFGDSAVPTGNGSPVLQFTPMVTNPVLSYSTFYYVNLEGVTVGGTALPNIPNDALTINQKNGTGGTVFDSGTTFTALVDEIYDPLLAAISAKIVDFQGTNVSNKHFELCYSASWDDWVNAYGNGVPLLNFKFGGNTTIATFDLVVGNAWLEYTRKTVCFAILRSAASLNIIGNHQQVGFIVLYDLENKQIGFGPANCTGTPVSSSNRRVVNVAMSTLVMFLSVVLVVLTF